MKLQMDGARGHLRWGHHLRWGQLAFGGENARFWYPRSENPDLGHPALVVSRMRNDWGLWYPRSENPDLGYPELVVGLAS